MKQQQQQHPHHNSKSVRLGTVCVCCWLLLPEQLTYYLHKYRPYGPKSQWIRTRSRTTQPSFAYHKPYTLNYSIWVVHKLNCFFPLFDSMSTEFTQYDSDKYKLPDRPKYAQFPYNLLIVSILQMKRIFSRRLAAASGPKSWQPLWDHRALERVHCWTFCLDTSKLLNLNIKINIAYWLGCFGPCRTANIKDGTIKMNGKERNISQFRKLSAYIMQDNQLHGNLTVEEAMTVATNLKLSPKVTKGEKSVVVSVI